MSNTVYIVLIIVLIVILVILFMYNKLVSLYNYVMKSQANIEVCLKKRFDLIPNLVETIKEYSKYEDNTLEKIVELRNNYNNASNMKLSDINDMDQKLNKYLAIVEQYPDLKANTQYLNLQKKLSDVENELQNMRYRYNDMVTRYNTAREVVPSNIIALMFAFKKIDLFKIDDSEKENVKVEM